MPQRPGRSFTTPDGRTVTLRTPSGSRHVGARGHLTFVINTERDEFGRGSSHKITGRTPNGRVDYYARNLGPAQVIPQLRHAEAAGWTHLHAGPESF